jgi:hypothetical protein
MALANSAGNRTYLADELSIVAVTSLAIVKAASVAPFPIGAIGTGWAMAAADDTIHPRFVGQMEPLVAFLATVKTKGMG